MTHINPTSSLKKGFKFQDLWVMKFCAEWLQNPFLFKEIKLETYPDEVENRFYFDDITIIDNRSQYQLFQLKHKEHPDKDFWDWVDFLKGDDAKESLFVKWSKRSLSLNLLKGKISKAAFITNGMPSAAIQPYLLSNGKISIAQLKADNVELYQQIETQIGGAVEVEYFFQLLEFRFGELGILDFEESLKSIYCNLLKATNQGFLSLLKAIQDEGTLRYPQPIDLQRVKEWCEWDEPRPLKQDFFIPPDFILFNEELHDGIIKSFKNTEGGIKVVVGKPGIGKSTYLSNLYQALKKQKIICIRHHFHISPDEDNPFERLDTERVYEALKYQFKQLGSLQGTLEYKQSSGIFLKDFIDTVAQELAQQNKALVIILDGIDHPEREGFRSQLEEQLKEIIRPQKGLWLILGMQEVAKKRLPQVVFRKCPEDEWTYIEGFSKKGVEKIFNKNFIGLNIPQRKELRNEIVEKLYEYTEGSPLHLRYTLAQLKNRLNRSEINPYAFTNLAKYSGDIKNYYDSIWHQMPELGKTAIFALSTLTTNLTKEHIKSIINKLSTNPLEIKEALESLLHLLDEDKYLGGLSVYHNSFELFIRNSEEFNNQKESIAQLLLNWLKNSNEDYLKWAEIPVLSSFCGDDEPILSVNRAWLTDAMFKCRDSRHINKILNLATRVAFSKEDYGKAYELSSLRHYHNLGTESSQSNFDNLRGLLFDFQDQSLPSRLNFSSLPAIQVYILTKRIYEITNDISIIDKAVDVLRGIGEDRNKSVYSHWYKYLVKVVATNRKHKVIRMFKNIQMNRATHHNSQIMREYLTELFDTKQNIKIEELLQCRLNEEEKNVVFRFAVNKGVFNTEPYLSFILKNYDKSGNKSRLIVYLVSNQLHTEGVILAKHELFPIELDSYSKDENYFAYEKLLSDTFYGGLLLCLSGKENEVKIWLREYNFAKWSEVAMAALLENALTISNKIKKKERMNYSDFFVKFKNLEDISRIDSKRNMLREGFIDIITGILTLLRHINTINNCDSLMTLEESGVLKNHKIFKHYQFFDYVTTSDNIILSNEAYGVFISEELENLRTETRYFRDRCEKYSKLAQLAHTHNDNTTLEHCLKMGIENSIAFSSKDFMVYDVLNSIKHCYSLGSKRINDWIVRIAPMVDNVSELTEDSSSVMGELGDFLGKSNQPFLYKYYYSKANTEDFYLSEGLWCSIVESIPFNTDSQLQMATTSLDKSSYIALRDRALTNANAQKALEIITDCFGLIDYQKEKRQDSSSSKSEGTFDYLQVKPENLYQYLKGKLEYERSDFLKNWLETWLKPSKNQAFLYNKVLSIIDTEGWQEWSYEFLSVFYPLALEYDKKIAFKCLYWYVANNSGWNPFFDRMTPLKTWKRLKEDFPKSYKEFLKESVHHSNIRYNSGREYFIAIPRMVEFFTFFNDLKNAEAITESTVNVLTELMANLELPTPHWIQLEKVDEIDILLERQLSPSPLVRERASTALAELLKEDKLVYERILKDIHKQELDTVIALRFLPFLKALEIEDVIHIKVMEVYQALPFTNVIIERLLDYLAYLKQDVMALIGGFQPKKRTFSQYPQNYQIKDSFEEDTEYFHSTIFHNFLNKLNVKTSYSFLKHWSYNTDLLFQKTGIEKDRSKVDFQWNTAFPTNNLLAMQSKMEEVFKSASLQTLEYLYDKQLISIDEYISLFYYIFPIDLSLWRLKPILLYPTIFLSS